MLSSAAGMIKARTVEFSDNVKARVNKFGMKTNWNLLTLVDLVNLFCWTTNKVIVYLFALTCQALFNNSILFAIKYQTLLPTDNAMGRLTQIR